jgi:hypothetical protein
MQKKVLKFNTIIGIITLITMLILSVKCFAVPSTTNTEDENMVIGDEESEENDEENYWEESLDGEEALDDETEEDDDINETSDSHEDEVYVENTTTNTATQNTVSNNTSTSSKISSYSTGSTLPEANLGLNNILNVILIAIGTILILLAIAILIRLKQ